MTKSLNWKSKAGYGSAEIGMSAIELLLQVYLLDLYVLAGLEPFYASLALAIAIAWDAVSDPLMGMISDRTPSKGVAGKRLPYLFSGALLIGVSFAFLYSPGMETSQSALFARLLFWYLVLNTAMTLIGVPHLALINDLTDDDQQRTGLFGWRLVLGALGLLVGVAAPSLVDLFWEQGPVSGDIEALLANRSNTGMIIGILATLTAVITCVSVFRTLKNRNSRISADRPAEFSFSIITDAFRSPLFLCIISGFVFISIGRAFNGSLALPFYKGSLGFGETEFSIILLILTLVLMLAAPCWVTLSKRFEKGILSVFAVAALTILTAFTYPFLPKGLLWPVIIIAVVGGALIASVVLLESMFSDVIEINRETASSEVSGAYYGLWRMAMKLARAGGIVASGMMLSLFGFEKGTLEQATSTQTAIAWTFGPGVALFFGVGCYFILRANRILVLKNIKED